MEKFSHCHFCGTAYEQTATFPRECVNTACGRLVYLNPTPVAINLQPVVDLNGRVGLAIAQRAIHPIGGWALIGGHMEVNGENAEEGARREFREETSVQAGTNTRIFLETRANQLGHLLIFVESDPIPAEYFMQGTPCAENMALDIMWEPRDLCFDIHTEMAHQWFARQKAMA